ncbi:MAG: hypothetical protein LBU32_24660 [Clostridiales bacterium]|nr:hypothetical protein [Clostridiales bacterium]
MKKLITLALALVLAFSLAACGSNGGGGSTTTPPAQSGNSQSGNTGDTTPSGENNSRRAETRKPRVALTNCLKITGLLLTPYWIRAPSKVLN